MTSLLIVLYDFLAELQEFDTSGDNSISHLFTESPEDGEPDDIHMLEDNGSEDESDLSCDFQVCRILFRIHYYCQKEYITQMCVCTLRMEKRNFGWMMMNHLKTVTIS